MRVRIVAVILLACFPWTGRAGANERPALLEFARKLQWAPGTEEAQQALQAIQDEPLADFGLPAEWPHDPAKTELHLATLDIVLFELYRAAQRFPKLQPQVEETVLAWNFCPIRDRQTFWDIEMREKEFLLRTPAEPLPAGRQGLGVWGFLSPDPPRRLVPALLSEVGLDHHGYQSFLHRIYRQQCFPHPDTGLLFDEEADPSRFGPLHGAGRPDDARPRAYAYVWSSQCEPSPREETPKSVKPPTETPVPPPEPATQPLVPVSPPKPKPSGERAAEPVAAPEPKPSAKPVPPKLRVAMMPAQPPSGATNYVPTPRPPPDSLGFGGNFFHSWPIAGEPAIGASISWRYKERWFIRAGVSHKYLLAHDAFSYSWGVGYDDWHPGTFTFQINNWGPILPSETFTGNLEGATANIAYKIDAEILKEHRMGASIGFDMPFNPDSNPGINGTWQWEVIPTWFVRVGLRQGLGKEGRLTWTYGFGRSDWHPFTWSLTYDNWGPNQAFQPNFTETGNVALSWSWAF
jgi:hypothetical protein